MDPIESPPENTRRREGRNDRWTLGGLIVTVLLGTAVGAGAVTCLGRNAARSADALGTALSKPMGVLPRGGGGESAAPTTTITSATTTAGTGTTDELAAGADAGAVTSQTTVTSAAVPAPVPAAPPVTTMRSPTPELATVAPVTGTGTGTGSDGGAPVAASTTANAATATDAGAPVASAADAGPTSTPSSPPPGTFVTEAPAWGASSYVSNVDGGAGRFTTEWPNRLEVPPSQPVIP